LNVRDLSFQNNEAVGYGSPNIIRDVFGGRHTTLPDSKMVPLSLTL
jgi:hypothetical protein